MKTGAEVVLPASLTGSAAILSIITGFISGVSPGIILLRGFVSAVLTLIFFMTVQWLIRKYLPELMDLETDKPREPAEDESPRAGSRVNIVMPEESPAVTARDSNPSAGISASVSDDMAAGLDSLDNKIAEETENVHNNKPEESDFGPTVSSRGNDLDILPSLDTLELNTGSASQVSEELDSVDTDTAVSADKVDQAGSFDPAEIAKAVKTVLVRDQQK